MGCKDQAYTYIRDAIFNDEFLPGMPLREIDISETLKMSRTPIREALRELEVEGVVVSFPARGTFVANITPYDVEEIYELRILFEMYALEKAFFRITDEDLDKSQAAFLAANNPFNWEQYHAADRAFHQLIIDKCGNSRMIIFFSTLNTQVERIRRFSAKSTERSSADRLAEHLHIIECIRKRDLDASKKALSTHLRNVSNSAIDACRMLSASRGSGF